MSEETQDLQSAPEGDLEPKLPQYANPRGESWECGTTRLGSTHWRHFRLRSVAPRSADAGQSPKPYGGWFDDCVDYLEEDLLGPGWILSLP
ncbi:Uncharacterised protein [Mobiluncus curtisii]|uniref:Uncharacterized protein n=1 Tax=Mobiluncus curtisii TaxID=2051 RepID=A0A2X3BP46_9ACTO|nr:Uncharacterised protein [Mobiluncus curtisii]